MHGCLFRSFFTAPADTPPASDLRHAPDNRRHLIFFSVRVGVLDLFFSFFYNICQEKSRTLL